MIQGGMIFCEIIRVIVFYWLPKYMKTTLFDMESYPVKQHVDRS